jgi:hypothetical protein
MKQSLRLALVAACTFLIGSPATLAQDDAPTFRPLEMWTCKFKDRKDQDDMDELYEAEIALGEAPGHAAWQLDPYLVGNRVELFDFIWLGSWTSGTAMGEGIANFRDTAGDISEGWAETVDCMGYMYASTTIQEVEDQGDGSGNFMLSVSDCKVHHGATAGQALGALRRWNDYRKANGSIVPTFAWFPAYGQGGAEFDFKLAQAFAGPRGLGSAFSWYVDNEAYSVLNAITQGIVDCDEARLYDGRTIRNEQG